MSALMILNNQNEPTRQRGKMYTVNNGIIEPAEKSAEIWKPPEEISFAELEKKDIPPIKWVVQDLIPEGVGMIAAPPKSYKSYMMLHLGMCVAMGTPFFGRQTTRAPVLYYDLESTERRAKVRAEQIGMGFPDNFFLIPGSKEVGRIGDGFAETLMYGLVKHEASLAIIDVFQAIRPPMKRTQTGYDRDYEDLAPLRDIAAKTHASIILVNHTVKMKQENVFNQVSGSIGTFGALDTMMVIDREDPYKDEATLYVTGRDIEPQQLAIKWSPYRWEYIGSAEDIEREKKFFAHDNNPITRTLRKLVSQGGGHWAGSASDLQTASQYLNGGRDHIYEDVRNIGAYISGHRFEFKLIDNFIVDIKRSKNGRVIDVTLVTDDTLVTP